MQAPHQAPTTAPAEAAEAPFIRLRAVSKIYPMGAAQVAALRGVDLALPAGRFTAIVGRSGSGKSTLLHLLAALDRPTAGEIVVGPWRLATLTRKEQARYRRQMVGVVFQQFNLIPSMTAFENVALPLLLAGVPPAARRARAQACLEQVDLAHRSGHRPTELSGGEQQRVAVARALVHDPALLLADEPTGNLDSVTGGQIVALLARLHAEQGRSVIVATHHLTEIEHAAEQVITLHDGNIVDEE